MVPPDVITSERAWPLLGSKRLTESVPACLVPPKKPKESALLLMKLTRIALVLDQF
jgi:hypothetical protein